MNPQIRQPGPGACPSCGLALEPDAPSADAGPNPELLDLTRRFWIGLVLALPVLAMEMGGHALGLKEWLPRAAANGLQLLLATPVVLWAGWPFFVRGWQSLARDWHGRLSPAMRQSHPAGAWLFVDYAGQTAEVIDGATGEVRRAQVFVAALGAVAAGLDRLPRWRLASFGGVGRQIVCDNLKAGVTAASRYEPGISRSHPDMATHCGTAVLPARARKPRDKAKVPVARDGSCLPRG